MKYYTKHSSGLQEAMVKFMQTRQTHSRVPYNKDYDLCLMLGNCIYQIKSEVKIEIEENIYENKTIKLCRRIGC